MGKPMTPKQEAFVREYLVDLNGAAAARRAGYKAKNSDELAHQLLRKTWVKAAIQAAMDARAKRTELSADFVIRNLMEVSERCMNPDDFDAQGALRANELLGKHLKLFTDKVEATGKDGAPLTLAALLGQADKG